MTDDAQKDLGVNWASLSGYSAGMTLDQAAYGKEWPTGTPSENLINDMVDGSATFPLATGSASEYGLLTSVLDADEFRMTLSALEKNKGVNIVSNPKIIVANEEEALISIIRKEPNLRQERQQSATDGTLDNITYELDEDLPFFDYGIKLEVIPSVNTSSNITVQINPSLTRKYADKVAGNNTYPIYDEKSIQTVFNLASGQTAAIGGLTEVTEGEEEHKVPVLGSIPFLGRLFSWKQTVTGQDETIIFVTIDLANTQQIEEGMGMPNDAELSRRQLILDQNNHKARDHSREYFQAAEYDRLEDLNKQADAIETERLERRQNMLDKEAKKAAKKAAKYE
jgi:type II secretory pathway component GspD/PulD (secretin)